MVDLMLWKFPFGGLQGYPKELGFKGWSDSALCQRQPFEVWWEQQVDALETFDHDKVVLLVEDEPVGGIVLVPGMDAQVGNALFAWHQFITPHLRCKVSYRKLLRLAEQATRDRNLRWLIWTHRDESTGRIFYTYKEVTPWVVS